MLFKNVHCCCCFFDYVFVSQGEWLLGCVRARHRQMSAPDPTKRRVGSGAELGVLVQRGFEEAVCRQRDVQ